MSLYEILNSHNYYQILNKSIIRNKGFHFVINLLDTIILLIKILDVYHSSFSIPTNNSIKFINLIYYLKIYSIIYKLIVLGIYLLISYTICIFYSFFRRKKCKKLDEIIINFFEFFLIRILISFYFDFLFSLTSLYFLLFFVLTIPFLTFIFRNMTYYHLTGFMLKMISFPFDDFTSLCDRQKLFIKIIISICFARKNFYLSKFMFLLQFIFYLLFFLYDTYIIFYKSYYLMNNEMITKTKYSHILSMMIIQILMLILNPEEVLLKPFLLIIIFVLIFPSLFMFLFYNPYNYIIIDYPENRVNAFYYLFLVDRKKNVTFFLDEKIKAHIYKCDYCQLCSKYDKLLGNNIIEFEKDNKVLNDNEDLFNILYNGKDKSMKLFNHIIKNIKKFGINSLYNNNTYYIINLIYTYYYSYKMGDIAISLNQLLLFNIIQENNKILISNHIMSIKQITSINEFFTLYKKILLIINEIISKTNFKSYIHKFFELANHLTFLNSSKFRDNIYSTKGEGIANCSYLLTTCSLLYEEIFNKTLSNYSIPIRENAQLHEDLLKNFFRQNNNITLKFNLKTLECKILCAGKELFNYVNTNFYDLFPNQLKEILIQRFSDIILNFKENNFNLTQKQNIKHNKKIYMEPVLLIKMINANISYYRLLNLKLLLLINNRLYENILLNGFFRIYENTLVTIHVKGKKEKILGYGNNDIMDIVFKSRLNFNIFKESNFMKNKLIQYAFSLTMNNIDFNAYIINEIKKKKKKSVKNKIYQKFGSNIDIINKEISNIDSSPNDNFLSNIRESEVLDDKIIEDISNNNTSSNNHHINNINDILEETASQSSALTKSSGNSFWNINKGNSRDEQNNFSSKKFLNLQLLLGGLLLGLLILTIILISELNLLKSTLSQYYNNYFDLHQFVRTFQQFSYGFMSVVCIAMDDEGNCKEYLSSLDTKEFNQTLFTNEQNELLSESCSDSIAKIIMNSETIHDNKLIGLFKGNISYNIVNRKSLLKINYLTYNTLNISFSDALLLLSNNMRIIMSSESKIKTRDKEPIYLISGLKDPFQNVKNSTEEISEYQISVYSYLINYKLFVVRFSDLNSRLNQLINNKEQKVMYIFNIFHNIIFVVMIFQIITILLYLLTYNRILAQILNSIIIKFEMNFDDDNDFKILFKTKIDQLNSIVNIYTNNPITPMSEINKNCIKYKNLLNKKKKNEQRSNMNKKIVEEEDDNLIFKDKQKYINWIEIYQKGYDKFYIIFTIIIAITDIIVYAVLFAIWIDYNKKSTATLELIYYSWNFERNTLRVVNFYNTMLFNNQTLEDITNDYFSYDNYTAIENIHQILYSYFELKRKRQNIANIYKSYEFFCDYNCKSLYDVLDSMKTNSFSQTLSIVKEKYNIDSEELKIGFVKECEENKPFIGNSVSPAFQNIYQKITDAMILLKNRTYEAVIKTIFSSSFPKLSSVFLNVIRYIIYIVGNITYTDASNTILEILGKYIIISLILYIVYEFLLFIFFFFIYIWNINTQCKNIFKLKSVFEVANPIDN